MGEVKAVFKTFSAALVYLGGLFSFSYGVWWIASLVTPKPVPYWVVLVSLLTLAFLASMWRLSQVAKRAQELEHALGEQKDIQDWLEAVAAEERAARENAERRAEQTVESARQLLRKVSPENISATLQRFRSLVVAARDYRETKNQWAGRQVRVMGVRRQVDADERQWHIATLNAGSAAGTRAGLVVEVAAGTQGIAYGQIFSVGDADASSAWLEPYDPAATHWQEALRMIELAEEYVPEGWIVSLAAERALAGISEERLWELEAKLGALLDCLQQALTEGENG